MYSDKKNIHQLIALMEAHGVCHVVLSPGSRNAPLIHSFCKHPSFCCYTIVDERSAAYFALGLILKLQKPVAVCCTSGTALLNYSSAAAEAFYQKLPLLVISADRPAHWIGQADGQTINQPNVLKNFVKKSVSLPEVASADDDWFCNRLINEAISSLGGSNPGPVHINIPLSEPLYGFSAEVIPVARKISMLSERGAFPKSMSDRLAGFRNKLVIVGQMLPDKDFSDAAEALMSRKDIAVIAEHTANIQGSLGCFDLILAAADDSKKEQLKPDLLITIGGHVVSKRIKQFLKKFTPLEHWHVGSDVVDTYQVLTHVADVSPVNALISLQESSEQDSCYFDCWKACSETVKNVLCSYERSVEFSDYAVYSTILSRIPANISLHLGNSSPVRYAQFFELPDGVEVYSNRGTSGIDGVVSTFTGFAAASKEISLLVVGELSFLYDSNGLWNRYLSPLCRIVVVNNSGGGIFRLIDGPSKSEVMEEHIEYRHNQSVKLIAESFGLQYLSASSSIELEEKVSLLFSQATDKPVLLEVFTSPDQNTSVYKGLFEHLIK